MEISTLLTPSYYEAERLVQNKIDPESIGSRGPNPDGIEGRDTYISQAAYDMLSETRFQGGSLGAIKYANALTDSVNSVMKSIEKENSALFKKDWDFTINKSGNIQLVEGHAKLTDAEKDYLKDKLDSSSLKQTMSEFADAAIALLPEDRGTDSYSSGLGKYDLNRENYINVFRGREFAHSENKDGNYDSWKTSLGAQLLSRGEEIALFDKLNRFHIEV